MTNNLKVGNYYHYIANVIAKASDFPIIIMLTILFTLQILKPVDLNYSVHHMEEFCSSIKESSYKIYDITYVSDQLKCIEYDINKKVLSGRKIIKNMIPEVIYFSKKDNK